MKAIRGKPCYYVCMMNLMNCNAAEAMSIKQISHGTGGELTSDVQPDRTNIARKGLHKEAHKEEFHRGNSSFVYKIT